MTIQKCAGQYSRSVVGTKDEPSFVNMPERNYICTYQI